MIRVGVSEELSRTIKCELLSVGVFHTGQTLCGNIDSFEVIARFADGSMANNKILGDMILDPYWMYVQQGYPQRVVDKDRFLEVRENVLTAYDSLLTNYPVDVNELTLWGVPSGGQKYAKLRAERLGLKFVELAKVESKPGKKTFRPATAKDAKLLKMAKVMVGSEDVGSKATSSYGAMFESDDYGLATLRHKTLGIDHVWVRGRLIKLIDLDFVLQTLVKQPIPMRISRRNRFYKRFEGLARTEIKEL